VISRAAVFPRIRIKAEKPSVDRVELSTDMITATQSLAFFKKRVDADVEYIAHIIYVAKKSTPDKNAQLVSENSISGFIGVGLRPSQERPMSLVSTTVVTIIKVSVIVVRILNFLLCNIDAAISLILRANGHGLVVPTSLSKAVIGISFFSLVRRMWAIKNSEKNASISGLSAATASIFPSMACLMAR